MGGITSKNAVDTALESISNALTDVEQDCHVDSSQIADVEICASQGGKVKIPGGITIDQVIMISTDCYSKAGVQTKIDQKIENLVKQQAETIKQALSLNPSDASSENLTKSFLKLSSDVKTVFNQKCGPNVKQAAHIKICASGQGSEAVVGFLNIKQYAQTVTKCMQEAMANTDVVQSIRQDIDQKAKTKEESIFSFLGMFAMIIVIIVIGLCVGGAKALKSPGVYVPIIIIVLAVVGYIIYTNVTKNKKK